MALVLRFDGQQIGDVFLRAEPGSHLLTPPVRRVGLFQKRAEVNSDSRNLLSAKLFYVMLKRTDNLALNAAIDAIHDLQGLVGLITIDEALVLKMTCYGWTIDEISKPTLPSAHGGRFCEELVITAVGPTPAIYA